MAQVMKVTPSQGEDEKLMSMGKQVTSMVQSQGNDQKAPEKLESNPRDRYMQKKPGY